MDSIGLPAVEECVDLDHGRPGSSAAPSRHGKKSAREIRPTEATLKATNKARTARSLMCSKRQRRGYGSPEPAIFLRCLPAAIRLICPFLP